jgi:CRISPR-associated protein Csm3
MDLEFKGKYVLSGRLACVTGLHIGGSAAGLEIGGVDNPVIKDPLTEYPFIPGSALKGKLRSLFEWSTGLVGKQTAQQDKYSAYDCSELKKKRDDMADDIGKAKWDSAFALARLFGAASAEPDVRQRSGPTRLTVRDAFPADDTVAKWEEWLGEKIYTEIKTENSLDRVTSEAMPRPMERVPAGSEFGFEMIVDVYRDDDHELFLNLFTAMRLLENSALGGSGSRGHGQVEFRKLNLKWRPVAYYRDGAGEQTVDLKGQDVRTVTAQFAQVVWPSAVPQADNPPSTAVQEDRPMPTVP